MSDESQKRPAAAAQQQRAGIDVAKNHMELYSPGLKLPSRLNNRPKTIAAWLKRLLVSCPAIHVVCESTGGCENALMRACWQAKAPVSHLNPARVSWWPCAKTSKPCGAPSPTA